VEASLEYSVVGTGEALGVEMEAGKAAETDRVAEEEVDMIDVENLTKTFSIGDSDVYALNGTSFAIDKGEMVAIMGPSGSGKSTLMSIIGCLDVPTSGTYSLDGVAVENMDDAQLAEIRGRKIGFVF
jgi:putative ABC transport system ATP-binding protein